MGTNKVIPKMKDEKELDDEIQYTFQLLPNTSNSKMPEKNAMIDMIGLLLDKIHKLEYRIHLLEYGDSEND